MKTLLIPRHRVFAIIMPIVNAVMDSLVMDNYVLKKTSVLLGSNEVLQFVKLSVQILHILSCSRLKEQIEYYTQPVLY